MSNELKQISDGIADLNKNVDSIKKLFTDNKLIKNTQKNNERNNKNSISDVLSKVGNNVKTSTNNLNNKIADLTTTVKDSIKLKVDKFKPTVDNIQNTTINNIVSKQVDKTKDKISVDKTRSLYETITTYMKSGMDYFKQEENERNANKKRNLFQKGMDKTMSTKNKIVEGVKDFKAPSKSILDGLGLLGLGAYGIYEALTSDIGRWTGTLKLFGKSLALTSAKMLNPLKVFLKSMLPSIPKVAKKGLLKVLGKGTYKSLAKTFGKTFGKTALKKIPVIGALMGLGFGIKRFTNGDINGGLLEIASGVASIVPVGGTVVSLAIDLFLAKRDYDNAKIKSDPSKIDNMEKNFTKNIDWGKLPIIGGLINGYKGIEALGRGDWTEARKYMGKGLLSTIPGLPQIVDFFGSDEKLITATVKSSSKGIKDNMIQKMKDSTSQSQYKMYKQFDEYNESVTDVVGESVSFNEKLINQKQTEKLKSTKQDNERMDKLISGIEGIKNAVEIKNEFDEELKHKEKFQTNFSNITKS